MRNEVFRCRSVMLAAIAFQACSLNHSDISPFRINGLRTVRDQIIAIHRDCLAFLDRISIHRLTSERTHVAARIVSDR